MASNITIARLNTLVTANAVQFTKELDRAGAVAKSRGASINSALSAIGVGLSVGAVVAYGKSIVDLGGQVTDLASVANLTPRSLQAITASAMQNGVSMEEVAKASEKMRQGLQDAAANGTDPLNKSLRRLGLSSTSLAALSMEEKWQVVAGSLSHAKNQQEAMNIASEIFGTKIGPKLRTTLADIAAAGGVEGLARSNAGMIITDDQIRKLDEFGDAMDRLVLKSKVFTVSLLDSKSSFQDLWAVVAGPKKLAKNDIQKFEPNGFVLPGSKIGTAEDPVIKKMRLAQEKEWKENDDWYAGRLARRAEKMAKLNADPFFQLQKRKDREEAMGKLSESFLGKSTDLGGLLKDIGRGPLDPQNMTPTDSYARIGMMTTDRAPTMPTQKEQTEHLKKIVDVLGKIKDGLTKLGLPATAAYAN